MTTNPSTQLQLGVESEIFVINSKQLIKLIKRLICKAYKKADISKVITEQYTHIKYWDFCVSVYNNDKLLHLISRSGIDYIQDIRHVKKDIENLFKNIKLYL